MLKISWNEQENEFDLEVGVGGLVNEDGFETAAIVSLFTDARARPGDELLDPSDDDLRGFWADSYVEVTGTELGSLLWLLDRSTSRQRTFRLADERGTNALAWMVEDGIADTAVVVSSRQGPNRLGLEVIITRERDSLRWSKRWIATVQCV